MTINLSDMRVAILAMDGFEESELLVPKKALEEAGAKVEILSGKAGYIKSWSDKDWGKPVIVDAMISQVSANDYDALMLPGGVINADAIRINEDMVEFVKTFSSMNKPVAAICHAAWVLVEADFVNGKTMTSWPSLRTDLENAGAKWVDKEVVVDHGFVTSRSPDDLPAFNRKMLEEFAEYKQQMQAA